VEARAYERFVKRGEIWWGQAPEEDVRPYLLLTRNEAIPALNKLIVAPATRTIRGISTEVQLSRDDGMPRDCVLSLDNKTLIRKTLLTERITTLGPERMSEVCRALTHATSC